MEAPAGFSETLRLNRDSFLVLGSLGSSQSSLVVTQQLLLLSTSCRIQLPHANLKTFFYLVLYIVMNLIRLFNMYTG